jgi:autotransporter-associated beta strand protein
MRTHITTTLSMILLAFAAQAATFTWDGGSLTDSNWLTDANWIPDGAPDDDGSATLAFSGGARTAAANNYTADTVFTGINFLNDYSSGKTAGFTLSGARITLGGNISSTAASTAITDTMSLPVQLNGTRTVTPNNNHHLTVSGVIGETGGSFGLTKTGGGNLTLNGANTYTGPTTFSGGFVYFNSLKNVGEGASALGAPATAESGTLTTSSRLFYTGPSTSTDRNIVLTGGIQFDVSTSSSTLTLNGTIKSANIGPTFRNGGNFVINGVIDIGSAGVTRTDNGTVYLNCPTNPFTGNIQISAGAFSITNIADSGVACTIGKGNTITLGQNGWNTTGKLQFTGASGGACNRSLRVETTEGSTVHGGILENTVAGQTLLLSGPVSPGPSSSARNPRLQLQGAGNGELSGVISGSIKIEKNSGAGTWTLSGANTYTGATVVSSGTLLINGSTHADSAVSVGASGTLGGTGTVNSAVSVAAGGRLAPGSGGVGTLTLADTGPAALTLDGSALAYELSEVACVGDRIDIAGTLVLNGVNTLSFASPVEGAPAGVYTQMTYAARSGDGLFLLDRAYPNATLTVGDTCVTLTVTGAGTFDTLVWVGDGTANVWDTTTANWSAGAFSNNVAVVFDDTGSDSPAVNISPAAVSPFSTTVNSSAKTYTIGGAGIAGTGGLTKSGTSALTLSGANTYTGPTAVNSGSLILSGSLSGSTLSVANGAALNETASGVIAGAAAGIVCQGSATLSGANTYGGVTTVGVAGISNVTLTVNNNAALGATAGGTTIIGGTTANFNNSVALANGVTVTGETLTLQSGSGRARLQYNAGSGSATWDGNIVLSGGWNYLSSETTGGTLYVGGSADDTVTGANQGIQVRGSGTAVINSTLLLGSGGIIRDDPGTCLLNGAQHVFGNASIYQGTFKLGAPEVMPQNILLSIGKSGNTADAIFDLNGMSQTLAGLTDAHYATGNGTQRVISAAPATLTVSNNTAYSFGLTGSSIEGAVSLVKIGSAALTLTGTNSFSGATVVSNGTLAVSATGTLGNNSTNIVVGGAGTLALSTSEALADSAVVQMPASGTDTAKINLAAGVNELVGWLLYGETVKRAGTYGSTSSSATYRDDTHFAGTGVLTVLHDQSGTVLSIW